MTENAITTDRRVFLAMPGYGQVTAGAARGFWRASAKPETVHYQYAEGSLLAQNFNSLWCTALNVVHRGGRVDYFAMQHADIEPRDGWLDILIDEMEAHDLDMLGVVAPIKCELGLTSIALARPDGDTWRPLCRLTMKEVFDLPETFTSDDVGHPLLLNTGLWVCRFDAAWCKQVHFEINDRIVFNSARDMFMSNVEPEDWFFSRLCHELGVKIGCTRKIQLAHAGHTSYINSQPWGDQFDAEYVPESLIPILEPSGFRFPYDVDGWLLPEEGRALAELATGKLVLEIGSYCGKSTICMAQTADSVVALDPHDGRGTPRPKNTLAEMQDNLNRYGVNNKASIVKGVMSSGETSERLFDLIFIDGAHDLESVKSDIEHSLRVLKPDGLLAFHDYRNKPGQHDGRWDPGVTEAVNELIGNGGELLSTHATVAVVRPPALIPLEV